MPSETRAVLQHLGIYSQVLTDLPPVNLSWISQLNPHYTSNIEYLLFKIDAYFLHQYKHSIWGRERELQKQARQNKGLRVDIAQTYPILRELLPKQESVVKNGEIKINGRIFTNPDVLPLWEGEAVEVRTSLHTYNKAWVYNADGMLCEAHTILPPVIKPLLRPWWGKHKP